MTVWRSSSVTLVCLGVFLFLVCSCQSACREAGLCCTGRDPSCISKGWRSDRSYGNCYCDQACVSTLDCCHDYETACPVPALITTGGYGNARKKRDIPDSSDIIGYCVQFQLTSMTKGCQQSAGPHTRWMQYLREGHHVCVECQPPALTAGQKHCAGDGEENHEEGRRQSLQWQAVGNPQCRGVWRRVGRLEACSCPTAHSFLFI
eukprot:superscaffoldBa00001703_g11687